MKEEYPYSYLSIPPTCVPSQAEIITIAVNAKTLAYTGGTVEDYTGLYSRKLRIEIPIDYQEAGCKAFGGKWIKKNKVSKQYWHFNGDDDNEGNHNFCVGVPESFNKMSNVILECVRTADNMLTAYRRYVSGKAKTLEILAFSHGSKGEKEYERAQRKK